MKNFRVFHYIYGLINTNNSFVLMIGHYKGIVKLKICDNNVIVL